jgi:hypothetical protein
MLSPPDTGTTNFSSAFIGDDRFPVDKCMRGASQPISKHNDYTLKNFTITLLLIGLPTAPEMS